MKIKLLVDYHSDLLTDKGLFYPKGEYGVRIINRIKVISHSTVNGLFLPINRLVYEIIN